MNPNQSSQLIEKGYQGLIEQLQLQGKSNPSELEVRGLAEIFLEKSQVLLPIQKKESIVNSIIYAIIGLGPLEFLLRDDSVSEIMVNGSEQIFIEKNGQLEKTSLSFISDKHLIQTINRIVGEIGRRIDESTPLVDARLADGSRVNAIIAPLSLTGPTLTIRKFPKKSFVIEDMQNFHTLDDLMAEFLLLAVKAQQNIVISGGTGAGKTSTLNACASLIPKGERLITIEDAAEIRIDHPHLISLESRSANVEGKGQISIRDLLKNALRMRPDRIVVGEIRGGEAIDMLQAMNTGHKGSLTTVHANAPLESLYRIETMVLMGDVDLPMTAIRPQVTQAIDIVVQQNRLSSGRRRITEIAVVEKNGKDSEYKVQTLFKYNEKNDCWVRGTVVPSFLEESPEFVKKYQS